MRNHHPIDRKVQTLSWFTQKKDGQGTDNSTSDETRIRFRIRCTPQVTQYALLTTIDRSETLKAGVNLPKDKITTDSRSRVVEITGSATAGALNDLEGILQARHTRL